MIKVTGQQRCRRDVMIKVMSVSRDVEEDVMIKVTGQQRCRRGCNDEGNWSAEM